MTAEVCSHCSESGHAYKAFIRSFKPMNSTEDAMVKLRNIVAYSTEKYAIGLMFSEKYAMAQNTGPFDGFWWPSVLYNLKVKGCQKNMN